MADFDKCKRCGKWVWDQNCLCRAFRCSIKEWDLGYKWKDGQRVPGSEYLEFYDVWGADAESAAVRFVEDRDCGDYPVIQGDEVTVVVKDGDTERVFMVNGQLVPEYWAREVREKGDGS